ncbi:MAG: hypothetical protein LKJ99_00215 [Acidaminococcaceae bacterium]|jgi:hypothetical protein|nr:hypothetical protein [Acidaminococcaceae bacterium]
MYLIKTNVDGCIVGNYYGEGFNSLLAAQKKLNEVLNGDSKAKIYKVVEIEKSGK